jgi:hypothetical protein
MTLFVETESHGTVESGFYCSFVQFVRLGEYAFATRHLCELVQHLAEHPNMRGGRIRTYDLDRFYERFDEHIQEFVQTLEEAQQSWLPELQRTDMDRRMENEQGEISLEDEVDLYDEGKLLPVKVSEDGSMITIGQYTISALHFGIMAVYVARGGFIGWLNGKKPEFAEAALEAIKRSENPLYKDARKRVVKK